MNVQANSSKTLINAIKCIRDQEHRQKRIRMTTIVRRRHRLFIEPVSARDQRPPFRANAICSSRLTIINVRAALLAEFVLTTAVKP